MGEQHGEKCLLLAAAQVEAAVADPGGEWAEQVEAQVGRAGGCAVGGGYGLGGDDGSPGGSSGPGGTARRGW
ncbi:hypothetical protein GCM10009665_20860 [Kitasatospora nipponensis]|uniref:Uncharacterized protein n=1 Tax=Kitasatospora nipponensis TaxID=258049 RepID=A0ABN1W0X9_9ACTN